MYDHPLSGNLFQLEQFLSDLLELQSNSCPPPDFSDLFGQGNSVGTHECYSALVALHLSRQQALDVLIENSSALLSYERDLLYTDSSLADTLTELQVGECHDRARTTAQSVR